MINHSSVKQTLKRLARRAGIRRNSLAAARLGYERNLLAAIGKRPARTTGRILCYHSIGQPLWGVNDVSPQQFRRHLDIALSEGYRIVPAHEIAQTGGGPKDLAITFDDGLKSVLTNAAPILKEYGVPWSVFVVSDWADGRHDYEDDVLLSWKEIELLGKAGADIGSHSVSHPDFRWLDPHGMMEQLGRSRRMIEQRLGFAPTSFAIPWGISASWSPEATVTAEEVGYTTIYAQAEELRPVKTVARTFVTRWDRDGIFRAVLAGAFDNWEEWV